jgi:hypothetical protein
MIGRSDLTDDLGVSGICTRCQQDLILVGEVLGCPVCGENIKLTDLRSALVLKAFHRVNSPSVFGRRPAQTTTASSETSNQSSQPKPDPTATFSAFKSSPGFEALWQAIQKSKKK